MTQTDIQTLAQRLTEGKLPVPEALRLAMSLATGLRKIHDEGRSHGRLTPERIELTPSGASLLPTSHIEHEVTSYTAPEVLRGRPADARSDIFSFGVIVYEMITGHRPFSGTTADALLVSMSTASAPATGSPALDSLLANCLAMDPASRWQRLQKAQMELKLLTVSARRTEPSPQRDNLGALVRAEVQQALAPRLSAQDKAIAEFQQAVSASLQAVQAHLCTIDAKLGVAQETARRAEEVAGGLNQRLASVEEQASAPSERMANTELQLQAATERMARVEQGTESIRKQALDFAESAALQLHALDQTVRSQAEALESARTALAQTDDLVERVVEALDSLQTIVLERSEDRPAGVN